MKIMCDVEAISAAEAKERVREIIAEFGGDVQVKIILKREEESE